MIFYRIDVCNKVESHNLNLVFLNIFLNNEDLPGVLGNRGTRANFQGNRGTKS